MSRILCDQNLFYDFYVLLIMQFGERRPILFHIIHLEKGVENLNSSEGK